MGRQSSFTVDSEEHNKLVEARVQAKIAKDHGLSLKIRAIILLGVKKKKRKDVAEICETSVTTVYGWQRRYVKGGVDGLRDRYKPKKCALSKEQQDAFCEIVIAGPEAAGHDTGTWTAVLLREVIKERFSTVYSISGVTKLLHRLNFSPQLPQIQLAKADPEAQKKWQEKTYPGILRRARKVRGRVFFSKMNASSSNQDQKPQHGPG